MEPVLYRTHAYSFLQGLHFESGDVAMVPVVIVKLPRSFVHLTTSRVNGLYDDFICRPLDSRIPYRVHIEEYSTACSDGRRCEAIGLQVVGVSEDLTAVTRVVLAKDAPCSVH